MPFKIFQLLLYKADRNIHYWRKCWHTQECRINFTAGCYLDLEEQKNKKEYSDASFLHGPSVEHGGMENF